MEILKILLLFSNFRFQFTEIKNNPRVWFVRTIRLILIRISQFPMHHTLTEQLTYQ